MSEMYGSIHTHIESDKDAVNAQFGEDGRINFVEALSRFHALGAKRVAVTEHGSFASFEDVYASSKKFQDLDVIPGCEIYFDPIGENNPEDISHMILVAKDRRGYLQLCKIITEANKNITPSKSKKVFYPTVTMELLQKYATGGHLICTSACIAGPFGKVLGLNLHNINQRTERHRARLEKLGCYENLDVLVEFRHLEESIKAINPTKEERSRAKETADIELQKDINHRSARVKEIRQSPEYLQKKEIASAVKARISSMKATRSVNLYLKDLEDKQAWQEREPQERERIAELYQKLLAVFGDNFYFELQNHGLAAEADIYNEIVRFAIDNGHPSFIASNDIHVCSDKSDPHLADRIERRRVARQMLFERYPVPDVDENEYCIKSDADLREMLLRIIQPYGGYSAEQIVDMAIGNIENVLSQCQPYEPIKEDHYPKFCENDREEFEKAVQRGFARRFPNGFPAEKREEYEARLKKEMETIESMGYASYHLIVADYLEYGRLLGYLPPEEVADAPLDKEELDAYITQKGYKRIGYSIGPGRGSAAGSLVCYLMGITDIDPIPYQLLFERFLNPERKSMPDIDSDFRTDIRDKVTAYCMKRYGEANVCKIITKAYQKSKGCLRIAGRYLFAQEIAETPGLSDAETQAAKRKWLGISDKLAKMVDSNYDPFATEEEVNESPDEEEVVDDNLLNELSTDTLNAEERECVRVAKLANGIYSGPGQHAAGVIISKDELSDTIPLMYNSSNGYMQTQCTMAQAEAMGLLKMDFLGLKNLDIITNISKRVLDGKLQDPEYRQRLLSDKNVFDLYCSGKTVGIFQFESPGMTNLLRELQPQCFEDIIAAIALYRPGPMDFIPDYLEGKKHPESVKYLCPEIEEILKSTYGTIVYQEQVMQIFQMLAGYSLGGADGVRKAISKKHTDEILAEKDSFIYGDETRNIPGCCKKVGISAQDAQALFDSMVKFGEYAFNKSHATAYALVSFFTAYLKCYYPAEFYAESMSYLSSQARTKMLPSYVEEMKTFGITLEGPDLEHSGAKFTASADGTKIYYGLEKIKGGNPLKTMDFERTTCLWEFVRKNPSINKTRLETMAHLGCFQTLWKSGDTPCSRREAVRWIGRNKPLYDEFLSCKALLTSDTASESKKEAARDRIIVVKNALTKNMQHTVRHAVTENELRENYKYEADALCTIVSAKEELEQLQSTPRDFYALYNEEGRPAKVAAIVLSVSGAMKTQKGNTYYAARLMDKNGNIVTRRFQTPPKHTIGYFLLQSEEKKYFYCSEFDETIPTKRMRGDRIPYGRAMELISAGVLSPAQIQLTSPEVIHGAVTQMVEIKEVSLENDQMER